MPPLVIYHGECTDGLGAALAAKDAMPHDTEWIAAKPGWDILNLYKGKLKGRHVYLLDYSFKRPVMEKLIELGAKITVIDHHKTAEADLKDLVGCSCVFDMEHSGAVLSWSFFNDNEPVPELFKYIETRDLWKFDLPYAPEVSTAIQSYGHNLHDVHWEDMLSNWRDWFPRLIQEGSAINRFRRSAISVVQNTVEKVTIWKNGTSHEVLAVNAQFLASEIGAWLQKEHPVVCIWYWDGKRKVYNFSLRSNTVDVSAIAVKFGGGGHAAAAGFTFTELPWKL